MKAATIMTKKTRMKLSRRKTMAVPNCVALRQLLHTSCVMRSVRDMIAASSVAAVAAGAIIYDHVRDHIGHNL